MKLIRELRVRWVVGVAALVILGMACLMRAQNQRETASSGAAKGQYVVLLKHGPNWLPNKSVGEQPLLEHAQYLNQQMQNGALQLAGPFLDDSGGLVVYIAANEAEARAIAEHDPGVTSHILDIEFIRPIRIAFDAATGKTPFPSKK